MSQPFASGDYLIFQVESGFGLLRILAIDGEGNDRVWHLQAFGDLFLDVETADAALQNPDCLQISLPHVALTTRAFDATQTSRMLNIVLTEKETGLVTEWRATNGVVSDRSIRLLLGLR